MAKQTRIGFDIAHTFAIAHVEYKGIIVPGWQSHFVWEQNIVSRRHSGVNENFSNQFMSLLMDALKRNEIHLVSLCLTTKEMNNYLSRPSLQLNIIPHV